jgi:hypothetical protein
MYANLCMQMPAWNSGKIDERILAKTDVHWVLHDENGQTETAECPPAIMSHLAGNG